MELQDAVLDKEAFREELKTQKMEVAKLEEQNLKIPEIRQELQDSRTMVHARMLKPRSLERNSRNIKGRRERLRDNRVDLAKELKKDKHDWKKPSETWTRLEEFDDVEIYWPLEDQTPVIYLR